MLPFGKFRLLLLPAFACQGYSLNYYLYEHVISHSILDANFNTSSKCDNTIVPILISILIAF